LKLPDSVSILIMYSCSRRFYPLRLTERGGWGPYAPQTELFSPQLTCEGLQAGCERGPDCHYTHTDLRVLHIDLLRRS